MIISIVTLGHNVTYLDVIVVVDERLDGVQNAVRHLVRLVKDEETPLALGDVATDPIR